MNWLKITALNAAIAASARGFPPVIVVQSQPNRACVIYLFIYFGPFSDFGFAFLADEAGVDQPSQTSLRPVGDYRQHLSL